MCKTLTLRFSSDIYQCLEELSAAQCRSIPDVIRNAISLEKFVTEQRRQGCRLLLEQNGKMREIVRP